jgi:hypothetical protein
VEKEKRTSGHRRRDAHQGRGGETPAREEEERRTSEEMRRAMSGKMLVRVEEERRTSGYRRRDVYQG